MPAVITRSASAPQTFDSPIEVTRLGKAAAGVVFLDEAGRTYIGTISAVSASSCPSLVRISADGSLERLIEKDIRWPLRKAPKDHVVTIANV